MFRNLDAEQARNSYTNQQMAEKLNISRVSYENKKKTGKFTALEAKRLCRIFHVKFDYLFKTEPDGEESDGDGKTKRNRLCKGNTGNCYRVFTWKRYQ